MTHSDDDISYEWECFQVLAYELPGEDPKVAERKIKARLKRKGLGAYEQNRVDALRNFKNALQSEITPSGGNSKYYLGSNGATADFAHYDIAQMTDDFSKQLPCIPRAEIERAVSFAVYIYYVR